MYTLDDMREIAKQAAASGLFGTYDRDQRKTIPLSEAAAFMRILRGAELGISSTSALSGIWFSQGKMVLETWIVAALLHKHGYDIRIKALSDTSCTLCLVREGQALTETETTFTVEEARKAGLTERGRDSSQNNWHKFPSDMLYARALSRMARRHAAHVFGGSMYVPGEILEESDELMTPPPPKQDRRKILPMEMEGRDALPTDAQDGTPQGNTNAVLVEYIVEAMLEKGYTRDKAAQYCQSMASLSGLSDISKAQTVQLERMLGQVRAWPTAAQKKPPVFTQDVFSPDETAADDAPPLDDETLDLPY